MKIEIFYTLGCSACGDRHVELRTAAQAVVNDLDWREISVLDSLDRAVELGVLTLPSIVIDGELVFSSLPTCRQLRRELTNRTAKAG